LYSIAKKDMARAIKDFKFFLPPPNIPETSILNKKYVIPFY